MSYCTVQWCVFITAFFVSTCLGGISECQQKKTVFIGCEETLSTLIEQRLTRDYGIRSMNVSDLTDVANKDIFYRVTKQIVCNSTNQESSSCLVAHLNECAELLNDVDFVATPLGHILNSIWGQQNTTGESLCDIVETGQCASLRPRFPNCYLGLYGDILTGNQLPEGDICRSEVRDSLECTISMIRDCAYLFNDTTMPTALMNKILSERWYGYSNAQQLCDCQGSESCWLPVKSGISNANRRAGDSVAEIYESTFKMGEIACQNHKNLRCASANMNKCLNPSNLYVNQDVVTLLYGLANETCTVLNSTVYKTNRDCIKERVIQVTHPCLVREKLSSPVTTCDDLKAVYRCTQLGLRNQCGTDFEDTVFELLRGDERKIQNCDVTSGVTSLQTQEMRIFTLCLLVLSFILIS